MTPYTVKHITRYTYDSPVIDCTNQLMLYPIADEHLEIKKHTLKISGNPAVEIFVDYFGNRAGVFSAIKPHSQLVIESIVEVNTISINMPDDTGLPGDQWAFLGGLKNSFPYIDFLGKESFEAVAQVKVVLEQLLDYDKTPLQNAMTFMQYVYKNFAYQQGVTTNDTDIDELWKLKAGVCQDFAHMLLVFLRMANIPGRYVSGYICPKQNEMRGTGATHAWVEVYLLNFGWLGLDPTNNCMVNDQHIRLAVGRQFSDCTPVKGTYKGSGHHTLEVSVDIEGGHSSEQFAEATAPVFNYTQKTKPVQVNSYRSYLEMQQQQQQQ